MQVGAVPCILDLKHGGVPGLENIDSGCTVRFMLGFHSDEFGSCLYKDDT